MFPPCITLEEHYFSTVAEQTAAATSLDGADTVAKTGAQQALGPMKMFPPVILDSLGDLGAQRIHQMNQGGVSRQVISHAPSLLTPSQCRAANNQLAEAITEYPDRLSGFAALPMAHPTEVAQELERCIDKLGFVGALIDNHANGTSFDGPAYAPLWETAERLDVPLYLHPSPPSGSLAETYHGSYSEQAAKAIGTFAFGWHSDVAVHVLKLFSAGVFDRSPKVKLILGHFGELLPFMLERIVQMSPLWYKGTRSFKEVWDENFWITTSGVWSVNPMACILRNTKIERILYSIDYPFASNKQGASFLKELQQSGLVDDEQLASIAYKNAQELLRVTVQVSASPNKKRRRGDEADARELPPLRKSTRVRK